MEISANQRGIDYNLRLKENHFCKSHLRVTSLPPSLPLFTSCRMTSNKVDYRFVLILCTGDYLFSCNGTHPLFSLSSCSCCFGCSRIRCSFVFALSTFISVVVVLSASTTLYVIIGLFLHLLQSFSKFSHIAAFLWRISMTT